MAEVTGNTPVEYGASTELPQPTGQSGWETHAQWPQEEKSEDYTPVQQMVAEFIGTFAFVSVAVELEPVEAFVIVPVVVPP